MRVAVYYAPSADDVLHLAGSSWLGRDVGAGACAQPDLPGLNDITADARRYGFHATLKPPMRLRAGVGLDDFLGAVAALAESLASFELPRLAVADLHGFLALRETTPAPALQAVADACVAWLDDLRAPPTEAEQLRRRSSPLSPTREANLRRWGYPDVFGAWQFHMTLTRRLSSAERSFWQPVAEAHFASALSLPRHLESLSIFTEEAPGDPFILSRKLPITTNH